MPLPTPDPIGTDPNFGVCNEGNDNGWNYANIIPTALIVPGNLLNKIVADLKECYRWLSAGAKPITAPVTLAVADFCKVISDSGAGGAPSSREVKLPAAGSAIGIPIRFAIVDGVGLRIRANTGETIRIGTSSGFVTASGGYIEASDIGCGVELVEVASGKYQAISTPQGSWLVDGA